MKRSEIKEKITSPKQTPKKPDAPSGEKERNLKIWGNEKRIEIDELKTKLPKAPKGGRIPQEGHRVIQKEPIEIKKLKKSLHLYI